MLLIVDADPIVYRSGFAAESISYDCVFESKEGELSQQLVGPTQGKSANDRLKEIEAEGVLTLVSKEKLVKAEPISHALEIARSSLYSIDKDVADHFKISLSVYLILSGKENWRNKVATLLPYKGNRDPSHKPVHYQALRDYMVKAYGAHVTDGIEADDKCAMLAREHADTWSGTVAPAICVASIDKDLDQIPGWHYDYMKKVFYFVDEEDAAKSFWTQCLSGDSTDNIGGVWKLGAKGAKKFVDEWYADGFAAPEIWQKILGIYAYSQEKPNCPYRDRDAEAVALENARLLYLQQKPDELWNPPCTPRGKFSVEYAD